MLCRLHCWILVSFLSAIRIVLWNLPVRWHFFHSSMLELSSISTTTYPTTGSFKVLYITVNHSVYFVPVNFFFMFIKREIFIFPCLGSLYKLIGFIPKLVTFLAITGYHHPKLTELRFFSEGIFLHLSFPLTVVEAPPDLDGRNRVFHTNGFFL